MAIKFNNHFSKKRIFRDITKERPELVDILSSTEPKGANSKVYQCNESIIIHSKSDETNHASISNSKGYGYVQEWEIVYVIERILKAEKKNVTMYVSRSGVIHLTSKEEVTLLN